MESIDELRKAIDLAPDGATHYSTLEQCYYKSRCEGWMFCNYGFSRFSFVDYDDIVADDLRSLSDIKRIIELEKKLAEIQYNFNSGVKCSNIPNYLAM